MPLIMDHQFTEPQLARLARFGATACVDIHCHCLPGLDDGPKTEDEAIALCWSLIDDGITHVVATPHQFGRYDGRNEAGQVRQAVSALNGVLAREQVPLTVLPGGDVRVDERLLELVASDRAMTEGDIGKYILLELPHETYIDLRSLVAALAARGITAIITHPERHAQLAQRPEMVGPWLEEGAMLQITAGSLVGDFGPRAERAAWTHLVSAGHSRAVLIATDAHDTIDRPPRLTAALAAITTRLGHAAARRVGVENPWAVISDQ